MGIFDDNSKYGEQRHEHRWQPTKVEENADSNREFRGVQTRPRQFTPIINFSPTDNRTMGTVCETDRHVASVEGDGSGQPIYNTISATRSKRTNGRKP